MNKNPMTSSEVLEHETTTEVPTETPNTQRSADIQTNSECDRQESDVLAGVTSVSVEELRSFVRKPVRTQTSVVVLGENGRTTHKAWSNDISPGGMSLVSCEPIDGTEVLLSILLPGLADQLVRGRIVYTSESDHHQFRFNYGVQFVSVDKNEMSQEDAQSPAEESAE